MGRAIHSLESEVSETCLRRELRTEQDHVGMPELVSANRE